MATGLTSAKNARADISGTSLHAFEWEVETDGGLWDATTFLDLGYEDSEGGVASARYSIRGIFSFVSNPFVAPPNIRKRINLVNVWLYPDKVANVNVAWNFPVSIVARVRNFSFVRDGVKYDFDGRNRGVFYEPGLAIADS